MKKFNIKKWAKLIKQGYTDKEATRLATSETKAKAVNA